MNILPAALDGMIQAETRVDRAAARLACSETPSGDTVRLNAEMVNLLQARTGFGANTRLVRVAGEMSKQLLDVLA